MVISRKKSLQYEKEALVRRLHEIESEMYAIEQAEVEAMLYQPADESTQISPAKLVHRPVKPVKKVISRGLAASQTKPLREVIIGMLTDVGYMMTNMAVRQLFEARVMRPLSGTRLGTLSYDELHRKNKWNTTVYGLTHPIQLVEGEIVRVKNVWARSDWQVENRVYLPTTDALINLHFLEWYSVAVHQHGYEYLRSTQMRNYIEALIDNLHIRDLLPDVMNWFRAKRVIVSEIERVREYEEVEHMGLKLKTLSVHKQKKKDDLEGDTDLFA